MLGTKIADFPALFEEIIVNSNRMSKPFPLSSQIDVVMIASHINRIDLQNNDESNYEINGLQTTEQSSQSLQGLQSLERTKNSSKSNQTFYRPDQRKPGNVFLPMSNQPHLVCIWKKVNITDWNEKCDKVYNEFIHRFGTGEGESEVEQKKAQTQGYDNIAFKKWRYLIVIESIGYENEFNVYIGKKPQYLDQKAFPEKCDVTDIAQILETGTFIFYEKYEPAKRNKKLYGGFAQVLLFFCVGVCVRGVHGMQGGQYFCLVWDSQQVLK